MNKTAIILGATGLTGNILLHKLIKDDRYDTIKLFSRSRIEGLPNKVSQYIGNLLNLEEFKTDFTGHELYCCIGTTAKKTPNKALYRDIDYGIPVEAAKLANEHSINTFLVISAMGANASSSIFYNKTKGEMERDVLKQEIKRTYILRPSLIGGERKEQRLLEKTGIIVFKLIKPFLIGKFKKYGLIDPEDIAKGMIYLANINKHPETIIASDDIKKLSKKK